MAEEYGNASPLLRSRVSLAPSFSPSPCLLSSRFTKSNLLSSRSTEPCRLTSRCSGGGRRGFAWVSLEGRLVGADEATSARAIGGGLGPEEAVAWQLFAPLHRVLIVAISAVAAAESKRARKIAQLQRSVDLRDQVLESMQQKLDDLCVEMNYYRYNPTDKENAAFKSSDFFQLAQDSFFGGREKIGDLNPDSRVPPLQQNESKESSLGAKDVSEKQLNKNDMLSTPITDLVEQEERRMSDLSFCSSVTSSSSMEIQLTSLAAEQEFYNLRKECEEKDAIIKELTSVAEASNAASSKRTVELEEIIKQKSTSIAKLKRDLMVLEEKVIQLTRLRRVTSTSLNSITTEVPVMATNILYDMSSSSSSSSDSDTPIETGEKVSESSVTNSILVEMNTEAGDRCQHPSERSLITSRKSVTRLSKDSKQHILSPLRERHLNRISEPVQLRQPKSSTAEFKRFRRHAQPEKKNTLHRKWV